MSMQAKKFELSSELRAMRRSVLIALEGKSGATNAFERLLGRLVIEIYKRDIRLADLAGSIESALTTYRARVQGGE